MKVYNTRPVTLAIKVLLIKILLFATTDQKLIQLFQSDQHFQATEFVDWTSPEKL